MINYKILHDSISYYEEFDFKRIESPWTVSPYIDSLTKPEDRPHLQLKHNDKCLVASGEQSFLYLYLKEFLPKGQFQTITPCFRYETFDVYHTKYFMKNELIKTDDVSEEALNNIINIAFNFFKKYLPEKDLKIITINDYQKDIEFRGIELGSYGYRSCEFLEWIFATGCAEPRLSTIIKQYNNGII